MTELRRLWIAAGIAVACLVALATMPNGLDTVLLLVGGWIAGATVGDWHVDRRKAAIKRKGVT